MLQSRLALLASVLLIASACAAKGRGGAGSPTSSDQSGSSEEPTPASNAAASTNGEDGPASGASGETTSSEPPAQGAPGAASPGLKPVVASGPPLPEVRVKTFGLHVGGGRNDDAERKPLLSVLERAFPRFLECYRVVEDAGKEGTVGVDLHIPLEGGRPRVDQPRTGIRGDKFKSCMVRVFESLKFEPQKRPTVISYSLKFNVGQD